MDNIGAGEGAQAYGHGGYVAESEAVARGYAENLSQARANAANGKIDALPKHIQGDVFKLLRKPRGWVRDAELEALRPRLGDKFDEVAALAAEEPYLYKMDVPDEAIDRMLDWDAPLEQQPANVQAAWGDFLASDIGKQYAAELGGASNLTRSRSGGPLNGESVLKNIMGAHEARPDYSRVASEYLRGAGVPGIRYLDGVSRDAGQGSRNYVTFDDSLVKILERNGKPVR
jgi:hypothetical protein